MAGKFKIMKKQITNFFKTAKAVAAEAEVKTLKSDLAAANKKISNFKEAADMWQTKFTALKSENKQLEQVASAAHADKNQSNNYVRTFNALLQI